MAAHGHVVLRFPPYYPDLNPIELIWADFKLSIGVENVLFNLNEVTKKCGKWLSEFGIEDWKKVWDCIKKNEKAYIEKGN
jgi:transposase